MTWHDESPRDNRENKDAESSKRENDIWHRPRNQNGGPPDLDVLLRKLKQQLNNLFSSKTGGGFSKPQQSHQKASDGGFGIIAGFVAFILFLIWGVAGIFIVDPAEQAVILRLGKYVDTLGPGPHWLPYFVEKAIVVNVDKVSDYSYSAKMLTKDENIVSVSVAIQYRIGNLKDYLFNAADPQESLRQATASALRQVVGHSTLNEIIAEGREAWGRNLETLLNNILATYQVGIVITSVSPQPARAPEEVQDAFDDAINAQEDQKRFKEQAYAYAASVVPIAEGQAKRIITTAQADEKQFILNAEGQTALFRSLLPEYLRQPALMKERLYLEMMENVLAKTSKIIVNEQSSQNLLYLPLEAMMAQSAKQRQRHVKISTLPSPPVYENDIDRNDIRPVREN